MIQRVLNPQEMSETINTPLTDMLGIKYPVMLAGMNAVATADLVAAVTNAGGIGTLGGLTMTPKMLRQEIKEVKELLHEKGAPFGVDLAIPQVGGSARKTNHDYTHGKLPELTDIIIEEKAALFVCAVRTPTLRSLPCCLVTVLKSRMTVRDPVVARSGCLQNGW